MRVKVVNSLKTTDIQQIAEHSSPSTSRPKGLFVIEPNWLDLIYSPKDRDRLRSHVDIPDRAFSYVANANNGKLLRYMSYFR